MSLLNQIITYFQTNSGEYLNLLGEHLSISFGALLIALIIGLPLGYLSYRYQALERFITSSAQFLRIIPSLAVLFILIPIIGVGTFPALVALVFLSLPSIVINTLVGFQEVSPLIKEVASGIGMNTNQVLTRVEIPLAIPYILNGMKLALIEIISSATLATYIGAGGLGTLIFTGLGLYRIDLILIGGLSVALLSLLTLFLFDLLIERLQVKNG